MISTKSRREYASLHTSTQSFSLREDIEMIWLENYSTRLTSCENDNSKLLCSIHRIGGRVMMKNCHQSFTLSIDEESINAGGQYFFTRPTTIRVCTTSGILAFKVMVLVPGTEIPPPYVRDHPNSKKPHFMTLQFQQELESVQKFIKEAYIRPKLDGKPRLMLLKRH